MLPQYRHDSPLERSSDTFVIIAEIKILSYLTFLTYLNTNSKKSPRLSRVKSKERQLMMKTVKMF